MLDSLRKPLFMVAVILMVLAVLVELGSAFYIEADGPNAGAFQDIATPGFGIPYLAILDGLVLFTIAIITSPLFIPPRIVGRVQGIVSFIVSLLMLIGAIIMIMTAIALLVLMISLFMAVPFGTVIYMAKFATFDTGQAAITLGAIMSLKLAFAGFLIFSHQRFLQNKGLMLVILTSFIATIIVSFLHGLVPRFLVSISDDIGAIVVAVLAAIWAIFYLIGSIPAIIKALRVDRALP
ncbi:MAG: hypothetical protein P8X90_34115 [Desulfobacterales bacterium]|jgi:hypothetical protein